VKARKQVAPHISAAEQAPLSAVS